MADNTLGLIFKISADPSQGIVAADRFGAEADAIIQRNIAATKAYADTMSRTTQQIEADYLALAAAQEKTTVSTVAATEAQSAALPTQQEYADNYARIKQESQKAAAGIASMNGPLGDFISLRRVLYSTVGIVSLGYMVSEWSRVAAAIKSAAFAVGGFGEAAQKAFQADVKASDDALIHFQGLTLGIKIATGQLLISQTNASLAAADTQRKAAQANLDAIKATYGPLISAVDFKDLLARNKAIGLAATLNERLIAQLKEMTKLRGEQSKQDASAAKHADAAAQHELTAADRWEAYLQRVQDRMMKAAEQGMALQVRAAAQEQSFIEKSSRETDRLMHRLDALQAKQEKAQRMTPADTKAMGYDRAGALGFNPATDVIGQAAAKTVQPLTAQRNAVLALNDALIGTHTSMKQFTGESAIASAVSAKFADAMGANIAQAIVYGESVGKAMERAAKAVLASLAEQAAAQALYSMATYFLDVATFNYAGAAAALTAAEIFGAVAVGAGAGAAAIPGGGGGGSRGARGSSAGSGRTSSAGTGRGGSGSGQQLVPGGNLPAAPKNGNLTIAIMGESEAGAWLANTINTVVQQGGAQLSATHTTAIPNPLA